MATNSTTPAERITRLLGEGVRILAVHHGEAGIDVTHDITGLLEELRKRPQAFAASTPPASLAGSASGSSY